MVDKFFVHDSNQYLLINDKLKVTANHLVYSNGQWLEIGKLKIGDKLLNSQGKIEIITSVKGVNSKIKVYNLEVSPYHTYFAEGYLVHNKLPKPAIPEEIE